VTASSLARPVNGQDVAARIGGAGASVTIVGSAAVAGWFHTSAGPITGPIDPAWPAPDVSLAAVPTPAGR
jgi:hypothetical protein